ncbi:hypothetical protein C1I99_15395 [Micromonospora deserti]|uniref:Nitroreductase domain-containing protein n=1 Tax=Micromonospora deserti TaxID=2070366 RepID=A0A2W2CI01_9ACTN|nr:hypothetical protein C1I99_15395 [Micromonospora deserti]
MADLTSLLAFRWSPRSFDPTAELTPAEASALLEAARWAPSAGNGQPWRFALGHRDDDTWKRILVNLPERDQRWAARASALLLAAHLRPDAEPARYAAYDLGQAVAHLTVQATALGLHVRQVLDLDRAGLVEAALLADGRRVVPHRDPGERRQQYRPGHGRDEQPARPPPGRRRLVGTGRRGVPRVDDTAHPLIVSRGGGPPAAASPPRRPLVFPEPPSRRRPNRGRPLALWVQLLSLQRRQLHPKECERTATRGPPLADEDAGHAAVRAWVRPGPP